MSTSPELARPISQELLAQEYTLAPELPQDFELEGRNIRLQRTEAGLTVVSENRRAVVIRPVSDGLYVVTGALATHNPSESENFEGAVRIAVGRLG